MEEPLKLGALLGLTSGMLVGLLIGVNVSDSRQASGLERMRPVALREEAPQAEHPARLQADIHALQRLAKDLVLRIESPEKVASARERWGMECTLLGARLAALEASATSPREQQLARVLRMELTAYNAGVMKVLALIEDGTIKNPRDAQRVLVARGRSTRS